MRDPGGCGGVTPGLLKGAPGLVCPGSTGPVDGGAVGGFEGATPGGGLDGVGVDGVASPSVRTTCAGGWPPSGIGAVPETAAAAAGSRPTPTTTSAAHKENNRGRDELMISVELSANVVGLS